MAEKDYNPINLFQVVGYLVPSNTSKSFKVIYGGRFVGLVSRDALLRSLRCRPMLEVAISRFIDFPQSKPTEQKTLNGIRIADPTKLGVPKP
jgi:hypothetical protein